MSNSTTHDYIILGAGPAGLQLGYFFKKAGLDYKIIERGSGVATSFKKYPRHRKLISINKIHTGYDDPETNLRWDWNSLLNDEGILFKEFNQDYFPDADALVSYLEEFASRFELNIAFNQDIELITREGKDGMFSLNTKQGDVFQCRRVIIASGLLKQNEPPIPGIKLTESYSQASLKPEDYVNQKVLLIGKGNSAFETADGLTESAAVIHVISPNSVRFAWQTHYVGDLRAVNNNFLDTYQLKSQNALLDAKINSIEKDNGKYYVNVSYAHAAGEQEVLVYDKVINCTGFKFMDDFFADDIRPTLCAKQKFPVQTHEWESENVKDMFFAGILSHGRDYKKTTSGFIHGFRYNIKALVTLLLKKYHDQPVPAKTVRTDVDSLATQTLARINRSSALWQQFGFLADAIDMTLSADSGLYYEDLPLDYIQKVLLEKCPHYMTVTLEFGTCKNNPFAIDRNPSPEKAQDSAFLHPVFRQFKNGKLVSEFHLLEDLHAEWKNESQHIKPLKTYLAAALASAAPTESAAAEPRVLQNA
jgi:thioredoxin reductase